jgi:cytochrome c oxidase subunit 2
MEILIGALCAVLLTIFVVQIGKARELASIVRNDPNEEYEINNLHAGLGMIFMVVFLVACVASFIYYIPYVLGWGPNTAASEHGPEVDYMFNLTLFFTSIVFFITQFLLFYFGWKYRGRKKAKALYWAHNEKLEMIWMLVPAVVMTFLVVGGLQAWNNIMIDKGDHEIEIEATGMQFAWLLRYPGRDGKLGTRHFTKIDEKVEVIDDKTKKKEMLKSNNPLGQDWTDEANIDDFSPSEIVLPVNKKVRVRILSRDVLHNFYLPQFRVKMDAVPGMPTYFIFKPVVTTDSMRNRLKQRPEWQVADKKNDKKQRWETFNYELACAELCGKSHFSMARIVRIVNEDQYIAWLDEQEDLAHYIANVRGKGFDPFKDKADLKFEQLLKEKKALKDQKDAIEKAMKSDAANKAKYEKALADLKPHYNTVVTTNNLEEAKKASRAAQDIAQAVLPTVAPPAQTTAPADSLKQDSVTTR